MARGSSRWAPYRAVLASRLRSQLSYRGSFVTDVVVSGLIGCVELAEVWIVFSAAKVLGGLDLAGALLLYGLAATSYSLADLVVGHADQLPRYVVSGRLDVFYLRPQPLLAQLVTSDISLRRLSRTVVGVASLVVGLAWAQVGWSAAAVAMLVIALTCGWLVFAGLFVGAAALQFFLIRGDEMVNALTYGGSYAARQPAGVLPVPLRLAFAYVVPAAFVAYLPTLVILGRPGPAYLPAWLGWALPGAAAATWLAAALLWRLGTRHYQSGGG